MVFARRFYRHALVVLGLLASVVVLAWTSVGATSESALLADASLRVTRGPYLQMGAPDQATIRWRTNLPSIGRVSYGPGLGSPTRDVDETAETSEHTVRLTGLLAATRYDYSVGTAAEMLAGADGKHFFVTPPAGTPTTTRIWVIGDSGTANQDARDVKRAFLNYQILTGNRHTDLWLMLGDNAYYSGTDEEYQRAVFEIYQELLPNTFLWPTIGNHDGFGNPQAYLDIFTLPTAGEAGGEPSGTERYYSFDHGDIHFVVLDSMSSQRTPTDLGPAPMMTWLQADLQRTDKTWLIAFWHHPPYSRGTHDSDAITELPEMREMRAHALQILEDHGVDLVLTGHSHNYERSYLLDGHYGLSDSLTGAMKLDHGSGRPLETGPYGKNAGKRGIHDGAIYVVAGSSGQAFPPVNPRPHPAMFINLQRLGSMVIDVQGKRLHSVFLREQRKDEDKLLIDDEFVIDKAVLPPSSPPAPPQLLRLEAQSGASASLTWQHQGRDEDGFIVERAVEGANFSPYARVGANAVRYAEPQLPDGTAARYRVRARNAAGISEPSNVVEVVAHAGTAEPDPEVDAAMSGGPGGPTGPAGPTERPGSAAVTVGGGGCNCRFTETPGGDAGGLLMVLVVALGAGGRFVWRRRRGRRDQDPTRPATAALLGLGVLLLAVPRPAGAHDPQPVDLGRIDAELARGGPGADTTRLSLRKVDLLRLLGRHGEALDELQRLEKDGAAITPWTDRAAAQILIDTGNLEAALTRLDHALTNDSQDAEIWLERGRLLLLLGRPGPAAADLARGIARANADRARPSEGRPEDHLLLARALRAAGQSDQARAALTHATARLGQLAIFELEAIDLALSQRRFAEALGHIDAQIATAPRKETWLLKRASVLVTAGQPAAARVAYRQAQAAIAQLPPQRQATRAVQQLDRDVHEGLARLARR